jgi:hypothetical protein
MTRTGETRNACRVLEEGYARRRPLGGVGHKLGNDIKMNFVLYLNK